MNTTDADKDLPLREDTRLLGRLLGDVLRAQTGEAGYARIEAIRQTAVRFRRAGDDDAPGGEARSSTRCCNDLPIAQTLDIVRAFSYFSHLANIAEDVHQNRRRRSARARRLAAAARQHRRCARLRRRARASTARRIAAWFADALVSPVLTAHPTEVQRKSILDCEREIARLLQWRDRVRAHARRSRRVRDGPLPAGAGAVADGDDPARQAQGRGRDRERPRVLPVHVPRRGAEVLPGARGAGSARSSASSSDVVLPPFLRLGSWIGGDRDGNPLVNGATLSYAIDAAGDASPSRTISTRSTGSARELSLSTRLVTPIAGAAARSPRPRTTTNPHRGDEPYRQALIGIYARVAATAAALVGLRPAARAARRPAAVRERRTSSSPTCARSTRRSRCTARRRSPRGASRR